MEKGNLFQQVTELLTDAPTNKHWLRRTEMLVSKLMWKKQKENTWLLKNTGIKKVKYFQQVNTVDSQVLRQTNTD